MIRNNAHKYSISAMCSVLQRPRSTYYYEAQEKRSEDKLVEAIQEIFYNSRNTYGTRKIKFERKKRDLIVSRRKIGRIMKELGIVSVYTVAQFKPHVDSCNESKVANELLNRQFQQEVYFVKQNHPKKSCVSTHRSDGYFFTVASSMHASFCSFRLRIRASVRGARGGQS